MKTKSYMLWWVKCFFLLKILLTFLRIFFLKKFWTFLEDSSKTLYLSTIRYSSTVRYSSNFPIFKKIFKWWVTPIINYQCGQNNFIFIFEVNRNCSLTYSTLSSFLDEVLSNLPSGEDTIKYHSMVSEKHLKLELLNSLNFKDLLLFIVSQSLNWYERQFAL